MFCVVRAHEDVSFFFTQPITLMLLGALMVRMHGCLPRTYKHKHILKYDASTASTGCIALFCICTIFSPIHWQCKQKKTSYIC